MNGTLPPHVPRTRMLKAAILFLALSSATPAYAQSVTYTRTEEITYHDKDSLWVMGQVAQTKVNGVVASVSTYDPTWAVPVTYTSFGKLQQTLIWDTASNVASGQRGTVKTVKDGNNNVTTLTNWKRGIPQSIQYPVTPESPSGATQAALVDDSGWIRWITDETGSRTCYDYDAMGRITKITYPSETQAHVCDTSKWAATTIDFSSGHAAAYGMPAGHWRQTTLTGNGRKVLVFDALWRPVAEQALDLGDVDNTLSVTFKRYDPAGRLAFHSYPARVHGTTSFTDPTLKGTHAIYDALDRATQVNQDWEGAQPLTTTTEYLSGFQTRVTSPRGIQTVTQYQAFDKPSTVAPIGITTYAEADTSATEIARDPFGKPTRIRRRDASGSLVVDRHYVYSPQQQLCKTIEPETGATVTAYDPVGNLVWSASGHHDLPDPTNCNTDEGYWWGRRVDRTYDARNRLSTLTFPDGRGNQSWAYHPDGLPANITTYNQPGSEVVVNAYSYNRRRMLAGESVSQPGWYTWGLGYGYTANGHLANQSYPTGLVVSYSPNALGQPTHVSDQFGSTYASGISYFPNGALKQFSYGNGVVHTLTQNARQLPLRSTSSGGVLDHEYAYDANGNVQAIFDHLSSGKDRYMEYDGLDRLTATGSAMFGGDHWHRFTYNALDNLTSWKLGGVKDYAEYVYDANNRLTNIRNTAGATLVGMSYDLQGNLQNKNGQGYGFDFGNRLREVTGKEYYRYDGNGRRVLSWRPANGGELTVSQYGQSGQLLYYEQTGKGSFEQVYLAGSLLAIRNAGAIKFQHTDALGSPVAVTNSSGAVIERNDYEPYGAVIGKPAYDGIGYTGHVMDGATGLTYMQQRYYDPQIGRFLSVDPVTAYSNPVGAFNRYKYASNNPYTNIDPDGRQDGRAAHGAGVAIALSDNPEAYERWQRGEMAAAGTEGYSTLRGAATAEAITKFFRTGDYSRDAVVTAAATVFVAAITRGRGDLPRMRVQDISRPGAAERNYKVNWTQGQFEGHLKANGYSSQSIETKKGTVTNWFDKDGNKTFTTRSFSNSGGASAEMHSKDGVAAKIRFEEEKRR